MVCLVFHTYVYVPLCFEYSQMKVLASRASAYEAPMFTAHVIHTCACDQFKEIEHVDILTFVCEDTYVTNDATLVFHTESAIEYTFKV